MSKMDSLNVEATIEDSSIVQKELLLYGKTFNEVLSVFCFSVL